MNHASAVGIGEGPGHLLHHADDLGRRERSGPANALCQRLAIDEAHHEAEHGTALLDGVHRHDVGVRERRGRPGLAEEAFAELRPDGQLRRQHLDGHGPVEREIAGEIDRAHAAATELALDGVTGAQGALDFFGFGG